MSFERTRAIFTKARKEAYERKHPEARAQVRQAHVKHDAADNLAAAFTNDTAEKTGRSSRDVRRDARRGSSIAPEVMEKVKADPKLNKGVVLDELAKTPRRALLRTGVS